MNFCSLSFVGFFLVVFAVYWLTPWQRVRNVFVLAASIFFYATWNWKLALVVCAAAAFVYFIGRAMDVVESERRRRELLVVSIVGSLALLAYFKYVNFFITSMSELLDRMGMHTNPGVLKVILPIGISFYTFEAINYSVDVYKRRVRAEKNVVNLGVFMLFFPHLIAGPIVRGRDFLPQLRQHKHFSWARMQVGVEMFVMGMFKKMVIADRMAGFADPVFGKPGDFGSTAVWVAIVAYALQIYCDFSGYTDMAIGCAHMVGYKLPRNFNMPYASRNVSEFWRRWHISLSSWLRDYLYIPLGGNRHGKFRTIVNLMLTMLLGGLWHGAAWTFVIWGGLHGMYLVVHRFFVDAVKGRVAIEGFLKSVPGIVLRMGLTLLAVCVAWVFFRCQPNENLTQSQALANAMTMLHGAFVPTAGKESPMALASFWTILVLVAVCHAVAYRKGWRKAMLRLPAPVTGFGYAVVLNLALVLAPGATKTFIYFQF